MANPTGITGKKAIEAVKETARGYLDRALPLAQSDPRFVDGMLYGFLAVGLISEAETHRQASRGGQR